jgi:hypothetical protein
MEKYLVPRPEKFKNDYEAFKKNKYPDSDEWTYNKTSAQNPQKFEDPVMVLFLPLTMALQSAKGENVEFQGLATVFKALKYDKTQEKYSRNELYKGASMLGKSSVVIPWPYGNLEKLNITNLPEQIKKALAHEIRHTTQDLSQKFHVAARKFTDFTGVEPRYLGNPHEFGVRVAAMKDQMDTTDLQNLYDSAVRKVVYSTNNKLNMAQKLLATSEIKKEFDKWQQGKEVDKAIDLLDVQNLANKLGFTSQEEPEDDAPPNTITDKQKLKNDIIQEFIQSFYHQDSQIGQLKSVIDDPKSDYPDFGMSDIHNALYYPIHPNAIPYRKHILDFIRNNWNHIVQKSFHKELGMA